MSKNNNIEEKYKLICAVCDDLNAKLQRSAIALRQGRDLLDRLMGVIEENRVLRAENTELKALLEGRDVPKDTEIKA